MRMKRRKWTTLRVKVETRKQLQKIKNRTGLSMAEVVHRVVLHTYAGDHMQGHALAFFVVYLDGQATFVVASKDAQTAELGLRQQLLGMKPAPKEVKALSIAEAPSDDVLRIGIAAIMTQLTNLNAILAAAAQGRQH